jgi:hypothetical protein
MGELGPGAKGLNVTLNVQFVADIKSIASAVKATMPVMTAK